MGSKFEDLAPQFLYEILSFLGPKHVIRWLPICEKIRKKLQNNPYFFREIFEATSTNMTFAEMRKRLKKKRIIPGRKIHSDLEEHIHMFPTANSSHCNITRLLLPVCCDYAYCCQT
jgi:hypothetical protein